MNITNRLTWLSYLIFLLVGCAFISQGVLVICISKTYSMNIANAGYLFFIPAVIQAITTYSNGYLLEKVNMKYEVIVALSALFISFACMITGSLPIFIIGLFFMGLGYGLLVSVPTYLILKLHPEKKFQKLNYLNFFFSLGGMLGPFILGQVLEFDYPWQLAVSGFLVCIVLIGLFTIKIPFSRIEQDDVNENTDADIQGKVKWNYSIYLISAAMFCYILSECIFSTWIVSYLKVHSQYSIAQASMGLTVFWLFITFGRFGADKIGNYMKVYQFILGSSIIAFVAYCFIFFSTSITITYIMVAIMGIGFAALYASILSYGMDQLPYNCPKLMSLLVISGTIGTILALPLSSFFVQHFGFLSAVLLGLIFLLILIIAIFLTLKDKRNLALKQVKQRQWGAITRRTKIYIRRKTWFSLVKTPDVKTEED